MEGRYSNYRGLKDTVVVDSMVNNGLMSLMSQQPISKEHFYLTGFETITFNRSRHFALETVLNSTVPFEKDLLILSNGPINNEIEEVCELHGVNAERIDFPRSTEEWGHLDSLLSGFSRFSHVLYSIEEYDETNLDQLISLSKHLNKKHVGLIVNCRNNSVELADVKKADIDYLICNGMGCSITSVVLARRSKLVQTEGVSRSYTHDLYAFWQKSLRNRKSVIEPMVF